MSDPFVGEIKMFGGNFAPQGWHDCDGAIMSIAENDTLFTLIGTTYGGDGQETFGLPDLRGRVPIHQGTGPDGASHFTGELAGAETATLTTQQIPVHSHPPLGSNDQASRSDPAGAIPASLPPAGTQSAYGTLGPIRALDPSSVTSIGGSQPHENHQPYLTLRFIISLYGIYPTQT